MSKNLLIALLVLLTGAFFIGCQPKYPKCEKDSHCREGEYCVNNLCQKCRDNGDCPQGQECQGGACREIPGYCVQSADCAEGQVCRENRCSPCMEDKDCTNGLVCIEGSCRKAECATTEDCPAGTTCVNRLCRSESTASGSAASGCNLQSVYFEFDSSELSGDARRVIEGNYDCVKKASGKLTVEGHCDPRGTTEYNMALGDRRARGVAKVMKTLGMDAERLRVVSKGEEEATGTDEASWVKDRRADFK